MCYLLGIKSADEIILNRLKGNLFENLILAELEEQNFRQYAHLDYYFWQDSNANEIDVLTKNYVGFDAFEIKATETISNELFKQMDRFAELAAPEEVRKTLIYGGSENQTRSKYNILSWSIGTKIFSLLSKNPH